MTKYLDETGLKHLWGQIESKFVDNNELKENVKLSYTDGSIKLTVNGEDAGTIDATPFIKDGMLEDVSIVEASEDNKISYNGEEKTSGKFIKFLWNTDGGSKTDYVALEDIAVSPSTANTELSKDITVTGVTVGNLADGTTLTAGMTLDQILTQILMKEIDVTATKPSVKITSTGTTAGTYEVGTEISVTLGNTYTDGKFTGQTGYSYTLAAGCEQGAVTYKKGNANLTGNTDSVVLAEGTTTYKCSSAYGASTAKPVTNFDNESSVSIAAGDVASSNSISFVGNYKYFMGYAEATTIAQLDSTAIRSLNTKTGWCVVNGTTTIVNATAVTSNGKSIIVACPAKYKLASVANGLGADILGLFSVTGTVEVALAGDVKENYNVYIYPITNNSPVEFKNMTLAKA